MSDNWELFKENVLPVKRGRRVNELNENIDKKHNVNALEKVQEKLFEENIRSQTAPLDALRAYINYIKWTRDTFPSTSEKTLKLLERCTCELKDFDILRDEERFISLWIEYADMVKTPGEIFSFMYNNKIGERVALFWIAWGFVAEKTQNYKLADQIFQKGVRKMAEPKDLLQKRYHQFQRRMARFFLNQTESNLTEQANFNTSTEARTVLGKLSKSQLSTGQRSGSQRLASSDLPSQVGIAANFLSNNALNQTKSNQQKSCFTIFADAPAELGDQLLDTNSHWTTMPKASTVIKENQVPISKWSEGGLHKSNSDLPRQLPPRNNHFSSYVGTASNSIPIFVDADLQSNEIEPVMENRQKKGLSLRKQLDPPVENAPGDTGRSPRPAAFTDTELVFTNPLNRHKSISTNAISSETTISNLDVHPSNVDAAVENDPATFKTTPFQSYAISNCVSNATSLLSPQVFIESVSADSKPSKASSQPSFQIFTETENADSKSSKSSSRPSFQIFTETKSASSKPFKSSSQPSFQIPTESVSADFKLTETSSQQSFQILTETESVESKPSRAKSKPLFQKFTETSGASSRTSKSSSPPSFHIFTETENSNSKLYKSSSHPSFQLNAEPENVNSKPLKSSSQLSFQIFTETESASPKPFKTNSQPSFQILTDTGSTSASSSKAVSIHGQRTSKIPKSSTSEITNTLKKDSDRNNSNVPSNHICSEINQLGNNPRNSDCEEYQKSSDEQALHNMLSELGILDSEDGTINTKLARRDIDSMFCSPGGCLVSHICEGDEIFDESPFVQVQCQSKRSKDVADEIVNTIEGKIDANKVSQFIPSSLDDPDSPIIPHSSSRHRSTLQTHVSPQPLPLTSCAGGSYKIASHSSNYSGDGSMFRPSGTGIRSFGGADLSVIQEASGEHSLMGSLLESNRKKRNSLMESNKKSEFGDEFK